VNAVSDFSFFKEGTRAPLIYYVTIGAVLRRREDFGI
jgi:hypothetical protein